MPYVVTTRRNRSPHTQTEHWVTSSREVVATLDEANQAVAKVVRVAGLCDVPESGGTVGPLPDGTVIEVDQTS